MGLVPLSPLPAAALQRGLASARVFQAFFQPQGSVTPLLDGRKRAETRCPRHRKNWGPGVWAIQSHLVPWHCRERGTGQLLGGPAWHGPWDAAGAEGKRCLPMLKKPFCRWGGGGWCPAPLGHSWDPMGEPLAHPGSLAHGMATGSKHPCPWSGVAGCHPRGSERQAGKRVAGSRMWPGKWVQKGKASNVFVCAWWGQGLYYPRGF